MGADTLLKKFFWYLVFAQVGNLQGIIGIKTWWFYLDDGVGCPSSSVFLYGRPYYIYFYHDLSAGSVREILYLVQLILWDTAVQCGSRRTACALRIVTVEHDLIMEPVAALEKQEFLFFCPGEKGTVIRCYAFSF